MAIARIIPRSVLADQVKDRLLEGILTGYYPPDSRIVETQVARELGTSQAPVREALRGLEALGVVEITPFRGARVRRPSRREIIEAYAVRSTLETLGSRLAVPRMTDADVAELAADLEAMRSAARADDGHAVAAGRRALPRPDHRAGRQRHARDASGLRSSRSPGRTSRWSSPVRTRNGRPTCTRRSWRRSSVATRRPWSRRSSATSTRSATTCPAAGPTTTDRPSPISPEQEEPMTSTPQLSEELSAGPAKLRIDVDGSEPLDHVLDDMNFLNYRLADVRISPEVSLAEPDIVWHRDADKGIAYDGRTMTLSGAVAGRSDPEGRRHDAGAADGGGRPPSVPCLGRPLSRQDGPVPWRGVEPRQVDGPDRGLQARRAARVDRDDGHRRGRAPPSWAPASRSSRSGPRAPSAPTRRHPTAVSRSSSARCRAGSCTREPSNVDVVIVPAIDGNFDPSSAELIPFERQFQTFHSLQNYFLLNELLAPGFAMPMVDTDRLREARADFVRRFAERPYFFIRAATPQVLLDEMDRVL